MSVALALSILAVTVGLSLWRPNVGSLRIRPYVAALLGAALSLAAGLVTPRRALEVSLFLLQPMTTLVSLMAITVVASRVGVFRWLAFWVARRAGGDPKRLYGYLFLAGTTTGALFTNDAAVLIFTPLVVLLVERIEDDSWSSESRIAFYYSALYVANLVGLLLISNPINLVVADIFGLGFGEYAAWMFLPAVVSIAVTYVGLRVAFRHAMPRSYLIPEQVAAPAAGRTFRLVAAVILALTLLGLFTESLTGIGTSWVALGGAVVLVGAYRHLEGGAVTTVLRGIGWDVVVFVAGIFVVAHAVRAAGATDFIGSVILATAERTGSEALATLVTALLAGGSSALMNNHPVAQIMALTLEDLAYAGPEERVKVLAALIGGDLGPKMLPLGSLAALLWFRLLRSQGIDLTFRRYVRIGVPITLAAIILSTLTLIAEHLAFG